MQWGMSWRGAPLNNFIAVYRICSAPMRSARVFQTAIWFLSGSADAVTTLVVAQAVKWVHFQLCNRSVPDVGFSSHSKHTRTQSQDGLLWRDSTSSRLTGQANQEHPEISSSPNKIPKWQEAISGTVGVKNRPLWDGYRSFFSSGIYTLAWWLCSLGRMSQHRWYKWCTPDKMLNNNHWKHSVRLSERLGFQREQQKQKPFSQMPLSRWYKVFHNV